MNKLKSLIDIASPFSFEVLSRISLIKNINRTGDNGSPSFYPAFISKNCEHLLLYLTHALTLLYIDRNAFIILMLRPSLISFYHKNSGLPNQMLFGSR